MDKSENHNSEDFVALVEKYDGRLTRDYVSKVGQAAAELKAKYAEAAQKEGLELFFNELPNFNDLCAALNYQLATSEDSDINVEKLIEAGSHEEAEQFVLDYLEAATRDDTETDRELRRNLPMLDTVRLFRNELCYDSWKSRLELSGNDMGVLDDVASDAENYLKGAIAVLGGGEDELRVIDYITTAGKKVTVQSRLLEQLVHGRGEDAEKVVFDYFNAVVNVFGEKEGFDELHARTVKIEEKRHELRQKAAERKTTKEDFDGFAQDLIDLKKGIDDYVDVDKYREILAATVEAVRTGFTDEAYNKGLVGFEARINEHLEAKGIEERSKKTLELIAKTEPYLRKTYNPDEIDIENINFGFVAAKADKRSVEVLDAMYKQLSAEAVLKRMGKEPTPAFIEQGVQIRGFAERLIQYAVPAYLRKQEGATVENPGFIKRIAENILHDEPYHMEMAYVAIAHSDAEKFGRFKKLTSAVANEAQKRAEAGENIESAVLSELGDVLDTAYPADVYFEEFPYAPLVSPEDLGDGEIDIAAKLGVDAKLVDVKVKMARKANGGRIRRFLGKAGRMFRFS